MQRPSVKNQTIRAQIVNCTRGSVSIEFALLAGTFFSLLFSVFYFGLVTVFQYQLDSAIQIAGRRILVETLTSGNGSDFVQNNICANTPFLINCNLIDAGTTVYTGNPASIDLGNVIGNWCVGGGGDQVLIVLQYETPAIFSSLNALLVGTQQNPQYLYSAFAVKREPTTVNDGSC